MMQFAVNATIFCCSLYWAARRGRQAWRDIAWLLLAAASLITLEWLSGTGLALKMADGINKTIHRSSGHATVIVFWCIMVATLAAALASLRQRPLASLGAAAAVLICWLMVALESFTGYMMPDAQAVGDLRAERLQRFYALHCALIPTIVVACTLGSAALLRAVSRPRGAEIAPSQVTPNSREPEADGLPRP